MKKILKHFLNIKFVLSFGVAWMIIHGWSFIALFLGQVWNIGWLSAVGGTWVAILMMPNGFGLFLPLPFAIFLQGVFFPKDEKLRTELKEMFEEAKVKRAERKQKRLEKKLAKEELNNKDTE